MTEKLRQEIIDGGGLLDMFSVCSAPMWCIVNTERILTAEETRSVSHVDFKHKRFIQPNGSKVKITDTWSATKYGYIYYDPV